MSKAKTSRGSKSTTTSDKSESKNQLQSPKSQLTEIRDLLFGEQVSALQQLIHQHNDETKARLDALEGLINQYSDDTAKKIDQLSAKIAEDIESNRLEHVSQEAVLEDKLEGLGGNLDSYQQTTEKEFKQTHDLISKQHSEMSETLHREAEKLSTQIETVAEELTNNKADRKTLANLLESMATNLTETQA